MEQENSRQEFTNFTRELSPEYIKSNIQKVVSCSSGPDLFCEIFDCEQNSVTVNDLVERYYPLISRDKNAEHDIVSEEQEKEQGISNNYFEDYTCYYCDNRTNNKDYYEQHVVIKHPGRPAYSNKAEIEARAKTTREELGDMT
jgi:hypothetical protein